MIHIRLVFQKKPMAFIFVYLAISSVIFSFLCSIKGKVWGKFLGRFSRSCSVRSRFNVSFPWRISWIRRNNCFEDFIRRPKSSFSFYTYIYSSSNEWMKIRLGLLIISLKSFSSVYQYEFTYMIKFIIIIDSKILCNNS